MPHRDVLRDRVREVLRRVGGPHSVSWFAFWVTLALNLLHHLTGSQDLNGLWPLRIAAVLAGQAAMFAVLLTAKATVLGSARLHPRPVATLLCFALAGSARSLMLLAVLGLMVDLNRTQVTQRLLSGPLYFTAYLSVCAYLADVFFDNQRKLTESAASQAALVAAREHAQAALRDRGAQGAREVRAELARQLDLALGEDPGLAPQQLDAFVNGTLRPMSHRLAGNIQAWSAPATGPVDPTLNLRRIVAALGQDGPFSPSLQAALGLATTFNIFTVMTFGRWLASMTLIFLAPWTCLTVGNRLLGAWMPHAALRRRIGALVGWTLVTAAVVAPAWALAMVGTKYVRAGLAYGIFVTVLLTAATVAARAALTAQRSLEAELSGSRAQLRWEVARVHQAQWQHQQALARALHGPVRSAAIVAAARLQKDPQALARDRGQSVRDVLLAALDESLSSPRRAPDLPADLQSLARFWAPLCQVRWEVPADLAWGDEMGVCTLIEILQEAVANSVRHGGARQVRIAVTPEDGCLDVSVADDGARPGQQGQTAHTGLGSRMLQDCCLQYQRQSTPAGTLLQFRLPFQVDPAFGNAG